MGKRSTFTGYIRTQTKGEGAARDVVSTAVVPQVLAITDIDATLAGSGILTGKFIPKGAVPLRVDIVGGGTGGTSPLLDVGLELSTPNDNGLVDGEAADSNDTVGLGDGTAGTLLGTEITETAEVTVSDGGGTNATDGTIDLYITYTVADDGSLAN